MNDFVELRKVISIIARRWWLLVLLTVVMAAGGFVYSQRQTKVYQGSVTLLVGTLLQRSQVERNDILVSEMLAQTYADLARRQPVLQGAIDTLDLQSTWTSLRNRITVSLIEETQLLQIKVQASSPDEAQLIADAVAHQLILLSPTVLEDAEQTTDQAFVNERLENLRGKIETGQSRLVELETRETQEVNTLTPDELRDLRKEIETLEGLIADWEKSYSEFLAYSSGEQAPNSLTIIEPAHASSRPIKPRPMVNTLIAAAVGFGLALAIVFVLEFLDDTLKSTDELTEALDLTALGTIGRIRKPSETSASPRVRSVVIPWAGGLEFLPIGTRGEQYFGKLVAQLQPSSPVAEEFRAIRSNIQSLTAGRKMDSILVTSPASGEGKSIVAANLGIVMAQAGLKTIVVDANLRHPVLHEIFDLSNAQGLADLLRAPEREINGLLQDPKCEGELLVLTSGEVPHNPSVLLGSGRMDKILAELNRQADVVIVDSPPVTGATDSALLAKRVDGTIMVAREGQTRKEEAKHTVSSLALANNNLLGAVLNARRRGAGWIAAVVVGLVVLAGLALMMFSGRGSSPAAMPSTASETSVAMAAAWTATVAALPTNTPVLELMPEETAVAAPAAIIEPTDTATALPTAMPTTEPTATPTLEPTATATAEPTATSPPEPTATPTLEPTATATREPTATATRVPTRTPTQAPSPAPTSTQPPPTPTQPAETGNLFPAPTLLAPPDRQDFQPNAEIVLTWEPVGELPADAFYVVSVAYIHFGETWFDDVPWSKDTSWTLTEHTYLKDLSDNDEFRWSVQVVRQTGTDAGGKPTGVPLSPKSEERLVIWKTEGSGGGSGVPPPLPPP
jgi:capsular exopolysaccharide synthesis family protein